MRKMNFWKSLMLGLASVTVVACSSDEYQVDEPVAPEAMQPVIALKIATPRAGKLVVEGGARAVHEKDEWELKTLNVYLFKKDTGTGDYTWHSTSTFSLTSSDPGLVLTQDNPSEPTYGCSLKIDNELIDQTVQIFLLANEIGTVNCTTTTTLDDFKATLAQATVTNGNSADALVDYEVAETEYGFAMSAQAKGTQNETEFTLTTSGVDVSADLVRNVARIDIENKTPNLTITGVTMNYTPDKSYLFPQLNPAFVNTCAAPTGASYISLNPTSTYWSADNGFTSIPYDATEADNYHERMLYVFEQPAAEDDNNCPYITIDYQLEIDGVAGDHSIDIYFKVTDIEEGPAYLPVERNHLYKVILGDGRTIDGLVSLKAVVEVWEEGDGDENNFVLDF